jgi:phenylacetate-coenzyme A ligase PaaK-like adenylate-forming protein
MLLHDTATSFGSTVIPIGTLYSSQKKALAPETMSRLKPEVSFSFPNQLFDLVKDLSDVPMKRCVVSGEHLLPGVRAALEKKGCTVLNLYGCNELGFLAVENGEREDHYMELFDDGLYIEVIDDQGNSRQEGEGQILLTDLANTSMPFIRYRLGDFVHIKKEGDKRLILPIGRKDNFTKIQGEIVSLKELQSELSEVLGHPEFCVVVEKDYSYNDKVSLIIRGEGNNDAAKHTILKKGISCSVRNTKQPMPQTKSRKTIHFLDRRRNDLKDASFTW